MDIMECQDAQQVWWGSGPLWLQKDDNLTFLTSKG